MVLKGLFSDAGARQHPGDEQMNSPSLLMYMCPFSIVWLVPFVIQKEPGALLTTLTRIGNSPEFAMLFIINVVSAYLANLFNFFNYEVIGCAFVVSIGEFKRGSRGHSQRIVVQKSDYPLGGYRVYVNYDWCVCLQRSQKQLQFWRETEKMKVKIVTGQQQLSTYLYIDNFMSILF
eukprot:TRINITY_DN3766_c0_g1_i13.p2 TRINITY_DN3766_c0_g1~~TRINITY_DN3766_c0_g1_i13.p2  ORF type:complete len:176 (-),score=9.55 TRINITY_DN3766_c0_g1_i13:729-1256(-)